MKMNVPSWHTVKITCMFIDDHFADVARQFRLQISLGKTNILVWSAITMEVVPVKCLDNFKYMCSTIFAEGMMDKITFRIQHVSYALKILKVKALQQKEIVLTKKLSTYRVVVLSSLLFGHET